ncbi:MAG: sulfurtransferase [Ottowia sp.]|jgi:thiosulfate/3-mercaptopyruvate sulfurtransferase|uniref:sulfurtransferase n=1 Tax=Ottowia beijingensis TaxID=1207057 RepID=UPI001B6F3048|nr:sulfurtransferase [Ottowia sp.]
MHYTHLISVDELKALHASDAPLLVFDCSSELGNPDKADAMFAEKHIAGAVQAHLERDLSAHDPANAVNGGRHPLPKRELFAQTLQALGFDNAMQAVVYDRNGANYCGRLWWMLKWAGHDAVAVLDGGLQAWEAAGGAVESGPAPRRARGQFALKPALRRLVHTDEVLQQLGRPTQTLIDARGAARYRGETEPLDPVAGHIPGALNRPFTDNLGADGRFKPREQLQAEFDALLAGRDAVGVVHHCGSGVSAVPNVLAMELAGYPPAALYGGSWSEWSRTPGLPMAQG